MSLDTIEIWASVVRDLSLVLGGLGTPIVAYIGLNTWQREFFGKRDTELCEEVLEKFYRAREAINWMRSPLVLASEYEDESDAVKTSSRAPDAIAKANVLFKRYNREQELFSSIHALRYRFMARFGRDAGDPFDQFQKALNELFRAARMLAHLWSRSTDHFRTEEQENEHWRKIVENEQIFWGTGEADDHFDEKIEKIIWEVQRECRRHING